MVVVALALVLGLVLGLVLVLVLVLMVILIIPTIPMMIDNDNDDTINFNSDNTDHTADC